MERTWIRVALSGLFITVLFLLVGWLDTPPEDHAAARTAAAVAASQEYDRVLELYGDRDAAMAASDMEYERVMRLWLEG